VFCEFRHGYDPGLLEGLPRAGYSIGQTFPIHREKPMPTITFTNEKKEIQVPAGANLRKEALQAGVALYPGIHKVANCHGFGTCGSCRVLITKGMENASPKGILEAGRLAVSLAYIGNEGTMRLACQTKVNGDITVTTCPSMNMYGENFFS
jgi:ferredoxin